MSEKSNIAWTDSTVNFWSGCTKVSPGCAHCYAKALSDRGLTNAKGGSPTFGKWGKGAPRVKHLSAIKNALAMNRKPWICDECGCAITNEQMRDEQAETCSCMATCHRRRIFSLSLGDWLDDEVPIDWLAEMLDTIRQCDQVTWILCTKRPENWKARMHAAQAYLSDSIEDAPLMSWLQKWLHEGAPKNIILLTSVENQQQADKRIPQLLDIPAACRGLSMEPLLGPIDLEINYWLTGHSRKKDKTIMPAGSKPHIDWLIIGGESGANARPCHHEWIRSLVEQGKAAGVATFVKQLGANSTIGTVHDKKGGDPAEWPTDLRIQQWPKGF